MRHGQKKNSLLCYDHDICLGVLLLAGREWVGVCIDNTCRCLLPAACCLLHPHYRWLLPFCLSAILSVCLIAIVFFFLAIARSDSTFAISFIHSTDQILFGSVTSNISPTPSCPSKPTHIHPASHPSVSVSVINLLVRYETIGVCCVFPSSLALQHLADWLQCK